MSEIESLVFPEINQINEGILTKQEFMKNNKNLLKIIYDNQGIEYTEGYSRKRFITFRKLKHNPFRCMQKNMNEETIRTDYFKNIKNDIFYSYDKFTNKLPIHITHFQVRKNFLLLKDNEISYTTELGIQNYNLSSHIKTDLCTFISNSSDHNADRYVICFDITETLEKDYLIVTGDSAGTVKILKIKSEELKYIRERHKYKYLNKAKFDIVCTEIITVGSSSDEILTNYVKFLDKGKYLLTTSNDCFIRIYCIEDKLVLLKSYKSNFPVNHCEINFDFSTNLNFNLSSGSNIIGSIGDSCFVELFDLHNEMIISRFKGHYDIGTVFRFFKEREHNFITGNQDLTCKIWDLRKIKNIIFNNDDIVESQKTLCANLDSIGDISIINRNRFIFCENLDFFNIYDFGNDSVQSVNYIGHFAGLIYQKDYDKIHIAVKENNINGILTYASIKNYNCSLEYTQYY